MSHTVVIVVGILAPTTDRADQQVSDLQMATINPAFSLARFSVPKRKTPPQVVKAGEGALLLTEDSIDRKFVLMPPIVSTPSGSLLSPQLRPPRERRELNCSELTASITGGRSRCASIA
jgi:hypothetical protein